MFQVFQKKGQQKLFIFKIRSQKSYMILTQIVSQKSSIERKNPNIAINAEFFDKILHFFIDIYKKNSYVVIRNSFL